MNSRELHNNAAFLTRRRWLQVGGGIAGGMLLPPSLQAGNADFTPPARQAIVVYLQGGLSHYESFDPKPQAPSDYRGEFQSIATSVPGVHFAEHLPLLASRAHMFNVVRSAYVDSPSHPVAIHMTLTGWNLPGASVEGKNRNAMSPSVGSVAARTLGPGRPGLPAYVTIPHSGQLGERVHYATAGLLGSAFEPLDSGMLPESSEGVFVAPPNLRLHAQLAPKRLRERLALLRTMQSGQPGKDVGQPSSFHQQALDMLTVDAAGRAFDLSQESLTQRARYGDHLWGQQTILARRLAEAGVPFTLVNYTLNQVKGQDWDTHVDNFGLMKNTLLPPMDRAVSTLLDDLSDRGLLDTTLVAIFGEFGRTPRINANAGRDHWDKVFSVILAGGGLKSGVVVGSSTRAGDVPLDRPVHFNEVLATIYHQLGVSSTEVFKDTLGRPLPVLEHGSPITELLPG
ncbi:MAG: DUF1501 domain-containing protein [Planctomycetota bacterium]|nr:DUF1501 domain-containing protein [Planctomycetota bacterium]